MSKTVKTGKKLSFNSRIEEIRLFEERFSNIEERSRETQRRKKQFAYLLHMSKRVNAYIEFFLNCWLFTLVTVPVFIFLLFRKLILFKPIFYKEKIYGLHGMPLELRFYNFKSPALAGASLFWYVFAKKLGLTGPGIRSYDSVNRQYGDAFLFNTRPGIFTLWYIRQAGGIAHVSRQKVEEEYYYSRCYWSDFTIILKTVIAFFFSSKIESANPKINLFGVTFHNLPMSEAVKIILRTINSHAKKQFFFVNPDCFNKTFNDKEYLEILQNTPDIFPDGIGVKIACKMINSPMVENVNGTDMLPFICELAVQHRLTIYLLGGKPGIAERMRNNLLIKYSRLQIVGFQHGYFDHEKDSAKVIDSINRSHADILMVVFGVPMQEKWIARHFNQIKCRAIMGVGGLFDFYSGNIPRAPKWLREIGMEWSFRLAMEPGRMFYRYIIGNPLFLLRVLAWRRKIKNKHAAELPAPENQDKDDK